ncbi:MAG: hypothetical protein EBS56_09045 [Planctomycetia bacterium]|nr:hypothetical protein [Planctomycetia bacterium]
MSVSPRSPDAGSRPPLTLTAGRLTISFTWCGDRWAHEIGLEDGGTWRSVEGPEASGGDPRWPASPVLVELSRLQTPRGPALLGVGSAGRSHFSASIDVDPDVPDRLRFEIACRIHEPPAWLGSTYRGPGGVVRVTPGPTADAPPATVAWAYTFSPDGLLPHGKIRGSQGPVPPAD